MYKYVNELRFLFQDEKTKGSKNGDKRKIIFISPFMRYRCVIPMVMDQEAKEREKEEQKKEETEKEEERLTIKIQNECVNEAEINESKNRVYEHFKQMSQKNVQVEVQQRKKKKKSTNNVILNYLRRQRKRKLDVGNESQRKNDGNDFSTSTSHLNVETVHVPKKAKQKTREVIEEQKLQESLAQVQSDNRNSVTIKSIR